MNFQIPFSKKITSLVKRPQAMPVVHGQPAPVFTANNLAEGMGMQYLMATVRILRDEKVPLGNPVNGRVTRGARFLEIPVRLDPNRVGPVAMRKVTSAGMLQAIQAAAQVSAVMARQEESQIIYQYQLERSLWQQYTRADLSRPGGIGLGAGRRVVEFSPTMHTMVAGMTRSGKSVTIESLIFALMAIFRPNQLRLALVDPHHTFGVRKVGMGVNHIGEFANAAHLYCPIAYTAEQVGWTVEAVYHEWKRRKTNNIQDGPVIVLVIDELLDEAVLGEEISKGKYVYQKRLAMLAQLAGGGAKFNIFLVLGTQDPKISTTDATLMRNLGRRLIGHCTDDVASRTLTGMPNAQAHLLTMAGDFLDISPETIGESSFQIRSRFQVAAPTRDDFERLARQESPPWPVAQTELMDEPVEPVPAPEWGSFEIEMAAANRGGNREIIVDPFTLAFYFAYKDLSLSQAERLGVLRRCHEKHRAFGKDFFEEVGRLRAGLEPRSPHYQRMKARQDKGGET
ncbi:MAG: hypothetical protein KJ077_10350 [Anaerolineae bacterium]|nr:hypothetical protein [Anaerolineae bacterium]